MTTLITMAGTAMAGAVLLLATPAVAQDAAQDRITLNILRECAKIADIAARVSCYDRNIGVDVAQGAASTVPNAPTGFGANQLPQPRPQTVQQFGANQLPEPRPARETRPTEMTARLTAATQRAPGLWLLTLEDGAQWEMVEAVSMSYDPPRKGATVEINAASMGSYIMRYAGQPGVRIRRVR